MGVPSSLGLVVCLHIVLVTSCFLELSRVVILYVSADYLTSGFEITNLQFETEIHVATCNVLILS